MAVRVLIPKPHEHARSETIGASCSQCGASVRVASADRRDVRCDHCGSTVILSDAVWHALHPPKTARPWTVELVGESVPAAASRLLRAYEAEAEQTRSRERERAEAKREQAEREQAEREQARTEQVATAPSLDVRDAPRRRSWLSRLLRKGS